MIRHFETGAAGTAAVSAAGADCPSIEAIASPSVLTADSEQIDSMELAACSRMPRLAPTPNTLVTVLMMEV